MFSIKNFSTLFKKPLLRANYLAQRSHASSYSSGVRITICGAAGRVGQPLCMLLKQSPLIDELVLFDDVNTCELTEELNFIDTKCRVVSYGGTCVKEALEGSKIIVVLASAPRVAAAKYDDAFGPNSSIICQLAKYIALHNPTAFLAIATNPVNSLVPLVSELFKKKFIYNPKTIFGITTLDTVRANTFVAHIQGFEPECVNVPVIGGNSPSTIVPVLSKAQPCARFSELETVEITKAIKLASERLAQVNQMEGPSLAAAFAIGRFVISLVKSLLGQKGVVECAFVKSDVCPDVGYLSTPIQIGPNGIQKNFGVPELTSYERCEFDQAIQHLREDIRRGEEYVGVIKRKLPCNICEPQRVEECPNPCKCE